MLHNLLFTPSESPNNNWGANWPGGLTDPSCPGEEKRERERERERAWVRFFVRPWPVGFVVLGALRLNHNTCRGEFLTGRQNVISKGTESWGLTCYMCCAVGCCHFEPKGLSDDGSNEQGVHPDSLCSGFLSLVHPGRLWNDGCQVARLLHCLTLTKAPQQSGRLKRAGEGQLSPVALAKERERERDPSQNHSHRQENMGVPK